MESILLIIFSCICIVLAAGYLAREHRRRTEFEEEFQRQREEERKTFEEQSRRLMQSYQDRVRYKVQDDRALPAYRRREWPFPTKANPPTPGRAMNRRREDDAYPNEWMLDRPQLPTEFVPFRDFTPAPQPEEAPRPIQSGGGGDYTGGGASGSWSDAPSPSPNPEPSPPSSND